jgi:hypothetical protein
MLYNNIVINFNPSPRNLSSKRPAVAVPRPAVGGPSQQVAAEAKAPVRLPRAQPVPLQVLVVTPGFPQ